MKHGHYFVSLSDAKDRGLQFRTPADKGEKTTSSGWMVGKNSQNLFPSVDNRQG